jgi:hypothetical protein
MAKLLAAALPNPPNDARDVAEALKRLGFEIELAVDVSPDASPLNSGEFGVTIAMRQSREERIWLNPTADQLRVRGASHLWARI